MSANIKAIAKRFYDNHKEQRRAETRNYNLRLRRAVFELLGGKCSNCGYEDWRALQIDHINGGGCKDRIKRGFYIKKVMSEILAGEQKYQLLCANCNWVKRYEKHETTLIK